jgi:hypothetical protein
MTIPSRLGWLARWALCPLGKHEDQWLHPGLAPATCRQEQRCAFCNRLRDSRTVHAYEPAGSRPRNPCWPVTACVRCGHERVGYPVHAYEPADSRPGKPCSPVTACVRCGHERVGSPVHAYGPERWETRCTKVTTCTRCGNVRRSHHSIGSELVRVYDLPREYQPSQQSRRRSCDHVDACEACKRPASINVHQIHDWDGDECRRCGEIEWGDGA